MKHFLKPSLPQSYSWQKRGKDASCGVCDCIREEAVGSHLSTRRINDRTHLSPALALGPSPRGTNALGSQVLVEKAASGSSAYVGLLPRTLGAHADSELGAK